MFIPYLEVGTPEEFRTCLHSSVVSFPSPFLSAFVNIRRIWDNLFKQNLLEEKTHLCSPSLLFSWSATTSVEEAEHGRNVWNMKQQLNKSWYWKHCFVLK